MYSDNSGLSSCKGFQMSPLSANQMEAFGVDESESVTDLKTPPVKEIRRLDRSMISSPVERRCLLLAYKICVGVYENNVGGLIEPVPW